MALHTTEISMSSPRRRNHDVVVSAKTIGRANIGACHGDTKAPSCVCLCHGIFDANTIGDIHKSYYEDH
jgi:hypothetical protein